jgi:hypothetical protein
MVASSVCFDLAADRRGAAISVNEYQRLAEAFRQAVRGAGLNVTELLGEPSETLGFSVEFKRHEIIVELLRNMSNQPQEWVAKIDMDDLGWFRRTRENRSIEMKRVEQAVQSALEKQFGACNIAWISGMANNHGR